MDNSTRSERTRQAGIQAALTIISRDGPKQLTFDAMARESRISKGGLMHQFPNKEAVLKALIDHQIDYFERFSTGFLATTHQSAERNLAAQLATWREAVTTPANITTAVLVAQLEDPSLLAGPLDSSKESARTIAAQATDPDLSLLRWTAARGLVLSAMLGLCPFSDEERARLFDRLQNDSQWPAVPSNAVR
ncbi:TetR/AcrR family transcriptional regulator [Ralstonia solanacearum]|uniref:TetR/AcrR family transcriptional regulator n=1 Tax=Ralstonia solanacearum TaxID=305 RepID=UPI0007C96F9F|nr:TetR/AcrR family transcriptional regulator [Ralstonia solanacearum]OAI76676.1 transcriptional regulator [Ralstonia solanacearum]RCW13493.1 TetR family transcriptional regulator [Ralstonia solanacearum]